MNVFRLRLPDRDKALAIADMDFQRIPKRSAPDQGYGCARQQAHVQQPLPYCTASGQAPDAAAFSRSGAIQRRITGVHTPEPKSPPPGSKVRPDIR